MIFSSLPFLFMFMPVFFVLYYVLPFKAKNYLLLIFSLFFYAWGEPRYVFLMIFVAFLDYMYGLILSRVNKKSIRRLVLVCSVVTDVGVLVVFKYLDFITESFNAVFKTSIPPAGLKLPIGISFFIFQTMSYVIDLYKEEVPAEKNFFLYLTYVSMFPQLIAGPIVRFSEVSLELHERTISYEGFRCGMLRFLQGLFKKVLIANNIGKLWEGVQAQSVFNAGMGNSVLAAWLGAFAFTLQLYYDFSAYSDMAIGMGKMLGFTYPENFKYPLSAVSVTDFWRRWHISLSSWFRDYVYIPLGGNRKGVARQIRNILIVWALTGLWHGAAWNFCLWGIYYGVLLICEKFFWGRKLEKVPENKVYSVIKVFLRHAYLLIIVVIGFTVFAIDDMKFLAVYLKEMFGLAGNTFADSTVLYYLSEYGAVLLCAIAFSGALYPWFISVCCKIRDKIGKNKGGAAACMAAQAVKAAVYMFLIFTTVAYLVADTYNPFLYFRF